MKEKFTHHFQQTSLTIVLSEIQAIRRKNTTRTACRVYKDGKIGIAGSIGKADTDELYAKAEQNLEYQIDYPVEPTKNVKSHSKIDTCKITDGELCNEVEKILKEFHILEIARTGGIALERGKATIHDETKEKGEFNYGKNVL